MSYSVDDVVSNAFKKRMILDSFFAFNCSGTMKVSTWVYDKGEWYYVSSSGAMLANDWVKDNGKWYYLASSGKMLRNTYTPDGYYVGNLGAWQ
ncbi:TPA: hypothetical protein ACL4X6_001926 [Streptococcus pneumoniae]|uniref:hypothetical protein n=1 Tax=Streptococcus pneumoniae TaxID=1313 RepID=UPI00311FFFD4